MPESNKYSFFRILDPNMKSKILLECPVFTVEAALLAAEYGADRLELCSSVAEGGETPGPGLFKYLKRRLSIPIFVMIRPKGGDFVYSDVEIEVMQEEIRIFTSLGADGFVFGALKPDGSVNSRACKLLVKSAGPIPCTFHRAVDASNDIYLALEEIIDCGFKRVLTSGGKNSVGEGVEVINELLNQAKDRIIVIPGGGMKPELVEPLRKTGFLKEIHAGCKMIRRSENRYHDQGVQFNSSPLDPNSLLTVDKDLMVAFRKEIG
tara:strand:+ start:107 stop:898 length:792 start_codon:yes stop_codon:yes gene_type:complete